MRLVLRYFLLTYGTALAFLSLGGSSLDNRVPLTNEHVDLRILYAPGTANELYFVARDGDHATNYASTNVVLMVGRAAELTLPEGFPEFGEPGSSFWILPATQDEQLLYLGFSAEGLPQATFDEPLTIRLVDVQAAGWFFVYQFDIGGIVMKMDSRNGIGPEDATYPIVGSHEHLNWGFSSNGFYAVTFRVEGRLRGATTNLLAANTTFLFAVEPLPPLPSEPATLTNAAVSGDQLTGDLLGMPGVTYQLQTSLDMKDWADGPEVIGGASPVPFSVPMPSVAPTLLVRALSP